MSIVRRRSDLDKSLLDLVRKIGWSKHFVPVHVFLSFTDVANWCNEVIGPQFGATWLDMKMLDQARQHQTEPSMRHFGWLRADVHLDEIIYVFRRDEDAVHFKLRWF